MSKLIDGALVQSPPLAWRALRRGVVAVVLAIVVALLGDPLTGAPG